MKHIANCTNTEFLKQVQAVRGPFKAWLEKTGIPAIRARRPEGYDAMTEDEQREALLEQARVNTPEIIDAALSRDFDGTVDLLCLVTFTDPADFDAHTIAEYIQAVNEILRDPGVRDFFTLYL